jgi:hypothetical protein|tara:strand:+ start:218 stop:418 length:201 start_codon:yes stop_codon:yes gene_type:complete
MTKMDTKLIVWGLSVVFLAGGGWVSLNNVESRVDKLEVKQDAAAMDIRQIMTTQAAICVAVDADCP